MGPKLSIVIPSFNQACYLAELLDQLIPLRQKGVELIVMDGGSTDGSREALERRAGGLDFWVSEHDAGQADAISRGLAMARGEWLAFQNSDDLYSVDGLERVLEMVTNGVDAEVIVGTMLFINASGEEIGRVRPKPTTALMLTQRNFINNQTLFVRRSLFTRAGSVNKDFRFCLDYEWFLRLFLRKPRVAYVPHVLGSQRLHAGTKTATMQEVHDAEFDRARRLHFSSVQLFLARIVYPAYRAYRVISGVPLRRQAVICNGLRPVAAMRTA